MSDQPDTRELLHKLLKLEGIIFFFAGIALVLKPYVSEFTLIDADTDLYLGYGLTLFGFINFFIANRFFGRETK